MTNHNLEFKLLVNNYTRRITNIVTRQTALNSISTNLKTNSNIADVVSKMTGIVHDFPFELLNAGCDQNGV